MKRKEKRIICEFTTFVPLVQRSLPTSLGRLEAVVLHRILIGRAPRRSVDGVATGPDLVNACNSFRGCFLPAAYAKPFSLILLAIYVSRYATAQCASPTQRNHLRLASIDAT